MIRLLKARKVLSGLAIALVIFLTVWTLHQQNRLTKAEVQQLEEISRDTQATLAELRAAIAAGPAATQRTIALLVKQLQDDHDALLRAIDEDQNTITRDGKSGPRGPRGPAGATGSPGPPGPRGPRGKCSPPIVC